MQLSERMGIRLVEAGADRAVATMPAAGNLQPYGLVHGGASVVLAETAGTAAATLWAERAGKAAVGIEINATHHRSVRSGTVTAVATPLHRRGSVATYEVVLTDETGRRTCTCRLTCRLYPRADGG